MGSGTEVVQSRFSRPRSAFASPTECWNALRKCVFSPASPFCSASAEQSPNSPFGLRRLGGIGFQHRGRPSFSAPFCRTAPSSRALVLSPARPAIALSEIPYRSGSLEPSAQFRLVSLGPRNQESLLDSRVRIGAEQFARRHRVRAQILRRRRAQSIFRERAWRIRRHTIDPSRFAGTAVSTRIGVAALGGPIRSSIPRRGVPIHRCRIAARPISLRRTRTSCTFHWSKCWIHGSMGWAFDTSGHRCERIASFDSGGDRSVGTARWREPDFSDPRVLAGIQFFTVGVPNGYNQGPPVEKPDDRLLPKCWAPPLKLRSAPLRSSF